MVSLLPLKPLQNIYVRLLVASHGQMLLTHLATAAIYSPLLGNPVDHLVASLQLGHMQAQ